MNYPGCVLVTLDGGDISIEEQELLAHPQVAGVVLFTKNYENPLQLKRLISKIKLIRSSLLIMVDHEGGRVQRFLSGFTALPPASFYGKYHDEHGLEAASCLIREDQVKAAEELATVGIDVNLMPLLDLDIGHNDVMRNRCFYSKPDLVSSLAAIYIEAMHSHGILVTGKHFPGHGWVNVDSHHALPYDTRSFEDICVFDLQPFIDHLPSLDLLMPAHIIFSEVDLLPVPFSRRWLQDILRQQLGYQGVVVTDDLSMQACLEIASISDCAIAAHEAGCDLLMICHQREGVIQTIELLEQRGVQRLSEGMIKLLAKVANKAKIKSISSI